MPKESRPSKPPVSKAKVRERLSEAAADLALVRISRWIADADQIEGFVVGQSKTWVLLAKLNSTIDCDGWTALRVTDIAAVTRYPVEDNFEIKALRARGSWPPLPPSSATFESLADLLEIGSEPGRMITIHREHERPDACWIGTALSVEAKSLALLEVNTDGGWARKPRRFDPEDITCVEFGGRYEDALQIVAGPPPAIGHR